MFSLEYYLFFRVRLSYQNAQSSCKDWAFFLSSFGIISRLLNGPDWDRIVRSSTK